MAVKRPTNKKPSTVFQMRLKPILKAKAMHKAKSEGVSLASVVKRFLERYTHLGNNHD